jgi:nitroreductase
LFRIDWEEIRGERYQNYYPAESIGIAAGMFLMACHQIGLATLVHTPSPMKFLREILNRPINEKPYLLIPVGFPSADCTVPDLPRKPLSAALQWNRC